MLFLKSWLRRLERKEDHRIIKKNYGMESPSFRTTGRSEMRWEDDVKHELKTIKTLHWKKQAKCRNEWKMRGPKFT